jgi:sarcosine oxidase
VDAGLPESHSFAGALASCRAHDLPHEVLDSAGLARRFPAYRLPDGMLALLQPDGGFLLPERCIVAHVEAAQAHGAEVRARERVLEWDELGGGGVRVRTDRGAYEAERLVLAPGAWADSVARLPRPLVTAERQVLGWFQPRRPELFAPERFPIFIVELDESIWYGFPVYGIPGFKLGRMHHREEVVDPDEPRRPPDADDEALLRRFVERCFPDGNGPTLTLKTCLFENSPDLDFVLDVHPDAPSAVVGVGFSGHGFKFASVVGEILADLAVDGSTRHPIDFLRFGRFAARV